MFRLVALFLMMTPLVLMFRPLNASVPWALRAPSLSSWSGGLTVLLLGLDRRADEVARTDSILLLRVGGPGEPASLLSVPRDLWVDIPGQGQDRINTAYTWGELAGGDGPRLARSVVESSLGVRVDRVVTIDFPCFQVAVDAVGGVQVDVPSLLVDPTYPTESGRPDGIRFEPGRQSLDGAQALQYVRTRASDSDFWRMRRQQQVVQALGQRMLNPVRAVGMMQKVGKGCPSAGTDLTAAEVLWLSRAAWSTASMHTQVIDESMVVETVLPSGAQVLMPKWELIRPMVASLFGQKSRGVAVR